MKGRPVVQIIGGEEILMSGEKTSSTRGRRSWQFNVNCTLYGDYGDNFSKSNND
jgi:hypothetical protein